MVIFILNKLNSSYFSIQHTVTSIDYDVLVITNIIDKNKVRGVNSASVGYSVYSLYRSFPTSEADT